MEKNFRIFAMGTLSGRFLIVALGLSLGLAACDRKADSPPPAAATASEEEADSGWREDRLALGERTYDEVCAACHEHGGNDAPRTGVREDWEGRSQMWQAVLFNHAKSGFLDMPGKGGRSDLSDEAVEAAAEYMLGRTFPELPSD